MADQKELPISSMYSYERECLTVDIGSVPLDSAIEVMVSSAAGSLLSHRPRRRQNIETMLYDCKAPTETKLSVKKALDSMFEDPGRLQDFAGVISSDIFKAFAEMLTDAGCEFVDYYGTDPFLLLWNATGSSHMRFSFTSRWGSYTDRGVVPKFLRIDFDRQSGNECHKLWPKEQWFATVNYMGGLIEKYRREDIKQIPPRA